MKGREVLLPEKQKEITLENINSQVQMWVQDYNLILYFITNNGLPVFTYFSGTSKYD